MEITQKTRCVSHWRIWTEQDYLLWTEVNQGECLRQERAKDFQDGGSRYGKVKIGNLMSVEDTRNKPRNFYFIEVKVKGRGKESQQDKKGKDNRRQEGDWRQNLTYWMTAWCDEQKTSNVYRGLTSRQWQLWTISWVDFGIGRKVIGSELDRKTLSLVNFCSLLSASVRQNNPRYQLLPFAEDPF